LPKLPERGDPYLMKLALKNLGDNSSMEVAHTEFAFSFVRVTKSNLFWLEGV